MNESRFTLLSFREKKPSIIHNYSLIKLKSKSLHIHGYLFHNGHQCTRVGSCKSGHYPFSNMSHHSYIHHQSMNGHL